MARLIAGRTGVLLDRLAAEDMLDGAQRQAVAADEAYPALERLLRTVEVAGHDPERVLRDAAVERGLDGARFPAQVLHHRITDTLAGHLTPQLSSYADLLPRDLPEQWHTLLAARAEAADQRRRELGAHTAETAPQWAVEPSVPCPRNRWPAPVGTQSGVDRRAPRTDRAHQRQRPAREGTPGRARREARRLASRPRRPRSTRHRRRRA